MSKVLVGFINSTTEGGINRYLLNLIKQTSSDEIRFDVLSIVDDEELRYHLDKHNSNVYTIPRLVKPFKQYRAVRNILDTGDYGICYFNISEAFNFIAVYAAKKAGVKKIYIHSHSSGNDNSSFVKRTILRIIHSICKRITYRYATAYFSCSIPAGKWMYPEKVLKSEKYNIIYNAIDTEKFIFKNDIRDIYRKKLEVSNKFVVGHVGNFVYQKNIFYMIDIVNELFKINKNARFLSVGEGPDLEEAKARAKALGIDDRILFLGKRNDVENLMQAMDYFILPSRFEGLPIVGIEAQVSGLKTLFSDKITDELTLSEFCEYESIEKSPKVWAEKINQWSEGKRISLDNLNSDKYDINNQKEMFKKIFK